MAIKPLFLDEYHRRRASQRAQAAEIIADRMLWEADPEFARSLGIAPPRWPPALPKAPPGGTGESGR